MELYWDNIRLKGTRFERKLGIKMEDEYFNILLDFVLDADSKELADDWVECTKDSDEREKYNRYMYSPKIDRLRHQDINEFYNDVVID